MLRCGKVDHYAKGCRAENRKEDTTNLLIEDIEAKEALLMMTQSLGINHNHMENSSVYQLNVVS